MWSDRKPQDLAKSNPPDNRAARGPVEPANVAVIGRGMIIRGQVRSAEHIQVDGELEGGLQLAGYDLSVGAQGRVRADVVAREVEVAGIIDGNVDATKKITVRKGGRLLGDLRTPGIVIEDGAYFKGKIEIVNSEGEQDANSIAAASAPKKAMAGA